MSTERSSEMQSHDLATEKGQRLTRTGRELPLLQDLADQLDEALMILRIDYLDRLHQELGKNEAKAILLKLLAPATTIALKLLRPIIVGV